MQEVVSNLRVSFDLIKAAVPNLDLGRKFAYTAAIEHAEHAIDMDEFVSEMRQEVASVGNICHNPRNALRLIEASGIAQVQNILSIMAGPNSVPRLPNGAEILFAKKQKIGGHVVYLCKWGDEFATWLCPPNDMRATYWGHHYPSLQAAVENFNTRCGIPNS
jgi:hypothetical protein